jgi:hypothetical protein
VAVLVSAHRGDDESVPNTFGIGSVDSVYWVFHGGRSGRRQGRQVAPSIRHTTTRFMNHHIYEGWRPAVPSLCS